MRLKLDHIYLILKISILLIYFVRADSIVADEQPKLPEKCQPITVALCKGIMYNETILPNIMGHVKQSEIADLTHTFSPLVKVNCSPYLQIFLCSVFVPVCTVLNEPLKPCKSLCQAAKNGCEKLMVRFGYEWPEYLKCEQFPVNDVCFGPKNLSDDNTVTSDTKLDENNFLNHPINGQQHNFDYPLFETNNFLNRNNLWNQRNDQNYQSTMTATNNHNNSYFLSFKCPINFIVPKGMDYVFRIQGKEHKDCGTPCDGILFDSKERHLIRIWTGMWAIFCVISTLFTISTFLIERSRFEYPERAIIFLSVCYFFIGLVYFIGFLVDDTVACNEPFLQPHGHTNVQMIRTITQGNKNEKCTLIFMALYFFFISNVIWWVVLTVYVFLSACLKWGHEVIEANAHYFHLFSWSIPAIMTICVLAMNKVEGDVLTGVCFVGSWNPIYLIVFVLIPLGTFLALGIIFLLSGFISLLHIRTDMKSKQLNLDKFDKFMLKIGFFSILYLIPSLIMLICFYYEQTNHDRFMLAWLNDVCSRFDYGIPCPPNHKNQLQSSIQVPPSSSSSHLQASSSIYSTRSIDTILEPMKPNLTIYLAKYLSFLMPGIISGFWIWSEKTVSSWNKFIRRIFCLNQDCEYV